MVNPGHRSRGCQPCRVAKVKCDEVHPACGRCQRTGRICPGYRRDGPSFRSMNETSATKVERRVQKQLARREREGRRARADSEPAADAEIPLIRKNSVISAQPITDWTEQTVIHFFNEIIIGTDGLRSAWGHLEWLPSLYHKARAVHLTKAVQAAALANLATISSLTCLEDMARRLYVAALHELGKAMADPYNRTTDETLGAMTLLGVYEVISGDRPLTELFHGHFYGQSIILQKHQHRPSKGTSLFGATNRQLMWRDMASKRHPTLCLTDWPSATYSSTLGERSARLTIRVVQVCARIQEILDREGERKATQFVAIDAVSFDAAKLHRDLEACFESEPKEWMPWSLPQRFNMPYPIVLSDVIQELPGFVAPSRRAFDESLPSEFPLRIDVYPSLLVCFLWSTLRCTWLQLLRAMAELAVYTHAHQLPTVNLPPTGAMYGAIATNIEAICASVPYSLGDIDQTGRLSGRTTQLKLGAFWLLWVLHKVCVVPVLDDQVRKWIVTVLKRIGASGLRQGEVLANLYDK